MANTFDAEMSQLEGARKIYAQGVSGQSFLFYIFFQLWSVFRLCGLWWNDLAVVLKIVLCCTQVAGGADGAGMHDNVYSVLLFVEWGFESRSISLMPVFVHSSYVTQFIYT